jgi:Uma2 family endonuclease
MILSKPSTIIGPRHHGRQMTVRAFEFANVEEGWLAELARGYVVVSEVPSYYDAMLVDFINDALRLYRAAHPGVIHAILGGMECKLLIPALESERHPDISVYLTAPKGPRGRTLWRSWVPELVIEVVSESSRDRDYTEKRDEYWAIGVKGYWIVDAQLGQVLALKRGRSKWTEKSLGPADFCETKLLPGFRLACRDLFAAAAE